MNQVSLMNSGRKCATRLHRKMRVGPSKPACRSRLQPTLSCCSRKAPVVSVKGKGTTRSCQGWIREMSVSEPLMRCRKEKDDVKTDVLTLHQD